MRADLDPRPASARVGASLGIVFGAALGLAGGSLAGRDAGLLGALVGLSAGGLAGHACESARRDGVSALPRAAMGLGLALGAWLGWLCADAADASPLLCALAGAVLGALAGGLWGSLAEAAAGPGPSLDWEEPMVLIQPGRMAARGADSGYPRTPPRSLATQSGRLGRAPDRRIGR